MATNTDGSLTLDLVLRSEGYRAGMDKVGRINDQKMRAMEARAEKAGKAIGKSLDSFCPLGPVILTADEAGHPDTFHLKTVVNGETRQDASVADLIFNIPTLIECISAGITLKPGDILATGTPVGVGIGYEPPIFLKPGDVVAVTIDPIGTLTNPVA